MNIVLAAKSGWGKSYHAQAWIEANLPNYANGAILDYKDEYKGLVKNGLACYYIAGPHELEEWGVAEWLALLEENPPVVIARHEHLTVDEWQEICTDVAAAARRTEECLVAIDEAHFVVPQSGKVPDPLKGLATTGRGEGTSTAYITQRLAEMDKTAVSQSMARILGGFREKNDLGRVGDVVEYPSDLHNVNADPRPGGLPEHLLPADRDRPTALRKHENDAGDTIGSEWIYSDDTGEERRLDTRGLAMDSTHYGPEGNDLEMPGY